MKRYAKFGIAAVALAALILACIFIGIEVLALVLLAIILCIPMYVMLLHISQMTDKEFEDFIRNYNNNYWLYQHRIGMFL